MRFGGLSLSFALALFPAATSAQNLATLLGTVGEILNALVYILVTLAIVAFFWGLVRYLASASSNSKADGLKTMLYGITTIFVMVSIWGIIALLQNTTGTGDTQQPKFDLDVERHARDLVR